MKKTFLLSALALLALTLSSCKAAETDTTVAESTAALSETASTAEQTEATTAENTKTETTAKEVTAAPITETSVETTAETVKECSCPTEWQHAYSEYLNSLDFLAGGIYLSDINGDDIPEAVIEINPFEMTEILYFNDDGMQKLELYTTSVWGSVRYIPDTKQILLMPMRGHTWGTYGYEGYYLYDWNGSDFEVTSTISRESGMYYIDEDGTEHSEFGQAYIDGIEVDNGTFEDKLAEFRKLEAENSYFPVAYINDSNEKPNPDPDSVKEYIKTNFPCFDNWDILYF
ncbi:MAG: hypothetical protein ACI4I1_06985 [Oscillospiraceae bacterium]